MDKLYKVTGYINTSNLEFEEYDIIYQSESLIRTRPRAYGVDSLGKIRDSNMIDQYEIIFTDISKRDKYELKLRSKLDGKIKSKYE